MSRTASRLLVPVLCAASAWSGFAAAGSAAPVVDAPFHPHFPKRLECFVNKDVKITVRYQTVTFDRDGAAKMKPGQSWHLAGATLELSQDLRIGGRDVGKGRYALSARKTEKGWELTLHEGRGFSKPGDDAIALQTTLDTEAPLFEHMNIDVQPAGDKEHTRVQLEVRFDTLKATTLIEVPK